MKKILFLVCVGLAATTITSCKKKGCTDNGAVNFNNKAKKDDGSCLYKPIIKLNGQTSVTINVGSSYTDAGATATNKDGSSVTVTTNNQVDTTTVGTYSVNYAASNSNGTSTAQRTVNVVIGAENWTGPTWGLTSTCSATKFPVSGSPTISAGATAADINIGNFFNLVGGTATGTINGAAVTIPQQTINIQLGNIDFSGTGAMNASGTQIQITYTYNNTTPVIGGSGTCVAIYDKQ
ncbi:MAG: DUF5011 domain-containing protein [Flavobacteriia bacterium]|nr:DUF5011 domain-containing protein [Flavobacteriia bacterium]